MREKRMTPPTVRAPRPPRPEDVTTIDGIVAAYYEIVSGPARAPRDWQRDRTLYLPGARFVAIERSEGRPVPRAMSHDDYVARTDEYLRTNDFFEVEIHRVTDEFGSIAQAWSTYVCRRAPHGPIFARGINAIELVHDGERWWIAAVAWDVESDERPIPAVYLPDS